MSEWINACAYIFCANSSTPSVVRGFATSIYAWVIVRTYFKIILDLGGKCEDVLIFIIYGSKGIHLILAT